MSRGVHGAAWGLCALGAAVLGASWAAWGAVDVWQAWTPCDELAHPIYAERVVVASVLRTRANTWSNLGFLLVGGYGLALAVADRARPGPGTVRGAPVLSALFGLACVYLAAGSALFHASLTRLGQRLDVAAMYMPLVALLLVSLTRARPGLGRWPGWTLLVGGWLSAAGLLFAFKWQLPAKHLMPALVAALLATRGVEHLRGVHRVGRWLLVSVACLLAAYACRALDVAGRFSGPDAWLQGHAVWHALCAASLGAGYRDQRQE